MHGTALLMQPGVGLGSSQEENKNHPPKNTDEKKPSQFDFIYLKACKL